MNKKKVQIGVIGSMLDEEVSPLFKKLAQELGKEIARQRATLLFGYEGDFDSLSQIAAESAEAMGGDTVAFMWGKSKGRLETLKSTQVVTGLQRGGGREFVFVLSCDAIIAIGGGAGTLTEIAIAYQAGIPIITLKDTGGWSDKLAGRFLDSRRTQRIVSASGPKKAVKKALELIKPESSEKSGVW